MLPIASTDVTLPTHKETSVSLSLSFVCTCRSVCIMMYVLCDVFIIMLLDHYGGHSPFKNFILLCDIFVMQVCYKQYTIYTQCCQCSLVGLCGCTVGCTVGSMECFM